MPLRALPEQPLVSVLIGNYNYGRYIADAIESVLRQTYRNFEIVICDDGSTDDSVDVARRYTDKDARVRLLTQTNGGQAAALNTAFAASRGDVICTLDSDDVFRADKLEKVVNAYRSHPDCGAVIHQMCVTDDSGRRVVSVIAEAEGWVGAKFLHLSVQRPYPPCSGMSVRRDVAERIFPVSKELRVCADLGISGPATLLTPTCLLRDELAEWRWHGDQSISGGAAGTLGMLSGAWLEKNIRGVQMGARANAEWGLAELGVELDTSTWRPIIEYRLALGILTSDRQMARGAAADLRRAFHTARLNYPYSRYLFWLALSALPFSLARPAMQAAFRLYYRLRRGSAL